MNDNSLPGDGSMFKTDKTYDLGKGITVTVARVINKEKSPPQEVRVVKNWTGRSPLAERLNQMVNKSKERRSPLQSLGPKSVSRSKETINKQRPRQEVGVVRVKRSLTPTRPTVVDFSDPKRKINWQPRGLKFGFQESKTRSHKIGLRQHRTSRDKSIKSSELQKNKIIQKSACSIHQALASDSVASDLMDSNLKRIPSHFCLEATATFGQTPQEDDLTLQWQHLAVRCESLDISISMAEQAMREVDDQNKAIHQEQDRLAAKALFILDKMTSVKDVEAKASCLIKADQPDFLKKMVKAGDSLGLVINHLNYMKQSIREKYSWFNEFDFVCTTFSDEGLRDDKRCEKATQRVEDLELLLSKEEKTQRNKYLEEGIVEIDFEESARLVYEAQIGKLKLESLEKMSSYVQENHRLMTSMSSNICSISREIDQIDIQSLSDRLMALAGLPAQEILKFYLLTKKLFEGIINNRSIESFSIDLVKEFSDSVSDLIEPLASLVTTVVATLFDNVNLSSLSIMSQLLDHLAAFSLVCLSTAILVTIINATEVEQHEADTTAQIASISRVTEVLDNLAEDDLPALYHYSCLQVKIVKVKKRVFEASFQKLRAEVAEALAILDTSDLQVMVRELDKVINNYKDRVLAQESLESKRRGIFINLQGLRRELDSAEREMLLVKEIREGKRSFNNNSNDDKDKENKPTKLNRTWKKSGGSVNKRSDSSVCEVGKDLAMQSLEDDVQDNILDVLDERSKEIVDQLSKNLVSYQSKTQFVKKLIKLLDQDFNLAVHCQDWIGRGLHGLRVRKGSKFTFGTAAVKKLDPVQTWMLMCSNKIVDLEKKGFCSRLMRLDPINRHFELFKPSKKPHTEGHWSFSHPESLENYVISVDEVANSYPVHQEDSLGTARTG